MKVEVSKEWCLKMAQQENGAEISAGVAAMDNEQNYKKEKQHEYVADVGILICKKCGTADNKKPYRGFRYWLRGDGYHVEPECKD